MKKVLLALLFALLAAVLVATPALAAKPESFMANYNQAQFQWRGVSTFGDWTPGYSYQNSATSSDFRLTGNVLHTSWSYSPLVTNLSGESTVYVLDQSSGLWIEKEGTVSYGYAPGYGDFTVANYFRGYIQFDGTPSASTFVHGVAYQWVYLLAPEDATLTGSYTANAVWDETVGAWLVGFSIYLWDADAQAYVLPFPDPFIKPVPASNFNPLDL